MKHIGTITDRSYYQEYSRTKDRKDYHYKICPVCDMEYETGVTFPNGMTTAGELHICRTLDEIHQFLTGYERFRIFEWGQFIFKKS